MLSVNLNTHSAIRKKESRMYTFLSQQVLDTSKIKKIMIIISTYIVHNLQKALINIKSAEKSIYNKQCIIFI